MTQFEPVIGLEVHVELKTNSKMFCSCPADWFGQPPNTLTCPVCLGLPGALPITNKKAIESVVRLGLALHCTINTLSKFDRKHYVYPDLPKGFQISQYDAPFCIDGTYDLKDVSFNTTKSIRIKRVHMEEDTGNLKHSGDQTLVDFNRSGVPLVEIVTEPDFENASQVKQFLEELQILVKYLNISDGNMEEGSMRLEPNISVRVIDDNAKQNKDLPNYKVEVKNINSFKFACSAIDFEINRHIELLKQGITPTQETRGFTESSKKTVSQRTKEDAHDYRYFPEPDIPPIVLEKNYISDLQKSLPELSCDKLKRYVTTLSVSYQNAYIITRDYDTVLFFEELVNYLETNHKQLNYKEKSIAGYVANHIVNKKISITDSISDSALKIEKSLQPVPVDERVLDTSINNVIRNNPVEVKSYKDGKTTVIMYLVGLVMKEMQGKADGNIVREKFEEALK